LKPKFKKKIMQSEKYIKIGKALINIWLKKIVKIKKDAKQWWINPTCLALKTKTQVHACLFSKE